MFKKEKTNYFYTRLYIVNSITYNIEDLNHYLFFIKGIKHKKRKDFLSMRKELKSKSRRKWLLGGSLAFASVALLTTGFATWVIGTQKTSGDGQLNIGVDTAEDNSVELTFSLDTDNTIFVAEDAGSSNPYLTIKREEKETVTKPDWNIKIKDLNVVVGKTFYNSIKDKKDLKIAFELQKDVTEGIKPATNSVADDMVGVRDGTGSPWNYIKLKTNEFEVSLPTSYPAGGKIYDINDKSINPDGKNNTFSFTWGSYFNGDAPSKFYQDNEKNIGSQTLREYYQKALQELQAMQTALTGKLKLTATFVY